MKNKSIKQETAEEGIEVKKEEGEQKKETVILPPEYKHEHSHEEEL